MIKFCKKCQEEKINKYCPSGYYFGWKEELTNCPNCGGEFVNIDFPAEDLSVIMSISGDIDFIEAMIKLRQDDIVEYQLKISQFRNQAEQLKQQQESSKPKCPTCGSANLKKISGLSKAGSVALWGIFATSRTSKTWHCNNCGTEW